MRTNNKGFTLIELMIVIAIIGILAAIAIPNFIAYRNKSFCSAAESDANNVGHGLSDYFAIPTITQVPAQGPTNVINLTRPGQAAQLTMSFANEATIGDDTDPNNGITITVVDSSRRCPIDYQMGMLQSESPLGYWNGVDGGGVYTKIINN
jgi:prepilin-type N-terminal cleavage/methylation domain-containing protein